MPNTSTPYKQVFSAIPAPVIMLDMQGHFAFANKAAYKILPTCIPLSDGVSCTPPDWLATEINTFLQHEKDEHCFEQCLSLETGQRHLQFTLTRLDQDAQQSGILITLHDISRHKRTEQALRQSEERYRMLVEHQSDLVVRVDTDGRLQFASPSFCMMFGIDEEQLVGRELCPIINISGQGMMKEAMKRLDCYPKPCYYEINSQTLDGPRWIGWAMKGVVDEKGRIEAIVGIGRDITDRKKAEKEILQLAHYDTLTGLPNRSLLHDRLSQAISLSSRNGSSLAVLFLDLDRFKHVNDAFGHQIGDLLLQEVSRRLNSCVRATDTVARIGGDEFVLILNSLVKCSQAGSVASKIVNAMSHPFQLGGHELYSGVSIGVALFPSDGTDVDTLLKHADIAMYQAKECGRGTFKFFSPDHNEKMVQRMQLEQALRRAIEHQELFLDYQPQIDNTTGAITGVEALVRWNHPQLGLLLPGLFIGIAEDTGLIIPLGEWVLRTACHQARAWQKAGYRQLRMAVNISPRQFQQRGLMPMIDEILQETGCDPKGLELELTETTLMDNPDEAAALLKALKRRGISLAIDDFGTGYSSLSHLKHFPIDRLKIDRSFINDLTRSPEDSAIVEAIIAMAHRLHLEAVAEGVEHIDQCTLLHNWGCTTSQGFLFSHPLPAQNITGLLASSQSKAVIPAGLTT
ncbi:MAG: EAL domain-containing protein [Geobacteraceae bacterium]|nr:EAL domain-containing protein [Geobacteraceae bacterium]